VVALQATVPAARRIAGADRYATAAALALDGGATAPEAVVATGTSFPDALAAAPLVAARRGALLLSEAPCAPTPTVDAMRALGWPDVTIVGGAGVVGDAAGAGVPCSPVADGLLASGLLLTTQVLPGPRIAHIVTVDRRQGFDLRVVTATGRVQGRFETTGVARRTNALVAVNAGFFSLKNGEPSHAVASKGRLLWAPGLTNTSVGFDPANPAYGLFRRQRLDISVDVGRSAPIPVARVNDGLPTGEQVALWTPESERAVPAGSWCRAVLVPAAPPAVQPDGRTATGYTVASTGCSSDPVPRDVDVLLAPGASTVGASLATLVPGTTATLRWQVFAGVPGVTEVVGGNLTLVFNSQVASDVTKGTGRFFTVRAARTAIGQRADGTVVLVTVDGGQPGLSIGMTARELADYMVSLGVTDAANLDGGGSTTLAVQGVLANRPSDRAGERPVGSVLLVVPTGATVPIPAP
jgi:hypothetical protein